MYLLFKLQYLYMPQTTHEFDLAYSRLNENQKRAVDTIDGPVLVLAGPGTGKTQVLTVRIANILKETDADPSSILALTYTEAAAKEMRARLIKLIGPDGYYVKVCTYHAFCADIIAENPERFSRPAGMQAATDLEKIQITQDILEKGNYLLLKPTGDPAFYLPYILGSISDLKREGYSIKRFGELVSLLQEEFEIEKEDLKKTAFLEKEKLVNKNLDLLKIYEKYQEQLTKFGRFDFDDMINWVVDTFETDQNFLLGYQEKFQYILGDEYQDTNNSQNRLIFSLSSFWGDQANVFVVGDPNQSIFRFQGASKENVLEFTARFPRHTRIVLDQNYRSTQSLLDASAHLLEETPLHHNVTFKDLPLKVAKFNSAVLEDEFLADTITRKIKQGIKPSTLAVITKDNADIENLVNLFKRKNIPYRLEGGVNILTTPFLSQFLKILKVVTKLSGPVDDLDLFIVLNYPYLGLKPLSVLQLSREAHDTRLSLVDFLLRHCEPRTQDVAISNHKVIDVFNLFLSWNSKATSFTLPEIFQIIFQESGLLEHILALPQPLLELNRFGTLFEDVKKQSLAFPGLNLFGYVHNLQIMEENRIKLEEVPLVSDQEAVTLTTAYKSKGLEWPAVFIYRFADTHWGNKTKREMIKLPPGILILEDTEKDDRNAEERRVFYVALTRAKKEVYLLGSTSYPTSQKMTFPAMFLSELPKENLKFISTKKYEKRAEKILGQLLAVPVAPVLLDGEKEYLRELIKDFKLSPTSLNSYLTCHYKFKLDNLYKIPRAKAPAMCFGTAVHAALEYLYLSLEPARNASHSDAGGNTKQLETKDQLLKDFETALRREVLADSDFQNYLIKGQKVLSAYYDYYQKDFATPLFTEKSFGKSLTSQIFLDDIPLTGKADRIDLISPSLREGTPTRQSHSTKEVKFVDYKTGQVRSRNEIEGLTKNSDGGYKRQLTFYHLLADLDRSFDYQVTQTELDFIEPDKTGNFHQERFNITPTEVDDLKKVIRETMASIRNLDFDRTTNYDHCLRCDFKNHCWPNGVPVKQGVTNEP